MAPAEVSVCSRVLLLHFCKSAYREVTFLPSGKCIQSCVDIILLVFERGVFCLCVFGFLILCLVVLFRNGIKLWQLMQGGFAETLDPNPSHRVSATSHLAE